MNSGSRRSKSNIARDSKHLSALADSGWRVAAIRECALKGRTRLPMEEVAERCVGWLKSGQAEMRLIGDETRQLRDYL